MTDPSRVDVVSSCKGAIVNVNDSISSTTMSSIVVILKLNVYADIIGGMLAVIGSAT